MLHKHRNKLELNIFIVSKKINSSGEYLYLVFFLLLLFLSKLYLIPAYKYVVTLDTLSNITVYVIYLNIH